MIFFGGATTPRRAASLVSVSEPDPVRLDVAPGAQLDPPEIAVLQYDSHTRVLRLSALEVSACLNDKYGSECSASPVLSGNGDMGDAGSIDGDDSESQESN